MSTTGINVTIGGTDATAAAVETARSRLRALNQFVSKELEKVTWKFGDVQKVAGKRFRAVRNELGEAVWREMDSRFVRMKKGVASFTKTVLGLRYGFQSVAAIVSTVTGPIRRFAAEMHELSDRAAEAGVRASDIQRLAGAFDELGVKHADLESVTKLFNNLARNSGSSSLEGFKDQMPAIAGIADRQERVNELVRIFGKEGARLECWGEWRPDGTVEWHDQNHRRALLISQHGIHCIDEGTNAMARGDGSAALEKFKEAARFLIPGWKKEWKACE